MNLNRFAAAALLCGALLTFSAPSFADQLPPPGPYQTPAQVHACYAAGLPFEICMENGNHQDFVNVVSVFDASGQTENFDSTFQADISIPALSMSGIFFGNGPVSVFISGRTAPGQLGSFQTEMLSLDLSGVVVPFGFTMIRESPTLQSLGQTTIADLGGGVFHVDSFFDVFTELSIDGGQTWVPSESVTRVIAANDVNAAGQLVSAPEPASLLLCAGALVFLGSKMRRRSS
jgi:hypothetical protein